MPKYNPIVATSILRDHGRGISHMRDRHSVRRFGLVFGAGISMGLGYPSWSQLLDRIAAHPDVEAPGLTKTTESATYRSQILFQHFRAKRLNEADPRRRGEIALAYDIEVRWKGIIRECLYRGVDTDRAMDESHYLHSFLPLIVDSPITVNYNFDDTLQRMLQASRRENSLRTPREYTTIWSSNVQVEARQGVIYHPNGFLPLRLADQPSQDLIFLEESFADQLIASTSGHYAALANHFAQTTCLFIGISLDDPTLRYLLRQSARAHPGHYHYYVSYIRQGADIGDERRRALFDSNFTVHNLITLFLGDEELAALGSLLTLSENDYRERLDELDLPRSYRYFLAGPVGVGKTTSLSNFRSLRAHEEWPDPIHEKMAVDAKALTDDELHEIDRWVDEQLERKNNRLLTIPSGIDIIDRAPLDAFAFVPHKGWSARAQEIRDAIGRTFPGRKLVEGHLILLVGDPSVLGPRALRVLRFHAKESLERQESVLREVYSPADDPREVTVIDTRGRSAAEVASLIAEVIHRHPYVPFNFQRRLKEICMSPSPAPEKGGE